MSIEVVSQSSLAQATTTEAGSATDVKSTENKSASVQETEQDESTEASETTEELEESSQDESEGQDEDDSDSDESTNQKPKRKSGFQRKIDKLTKRNAEKERELEYWRAEALKSKQQKPETEQAQEQVETPKLSHQDDGRPNADEFDTYEAYIDALTDWKLEQKERAKEIQAKETQVKNEYQAKVDAHSKRLNEFVQKHDDFQEVIENVDDINMSLAVQQAILESDDGPHLMYELAKQRDEYARICQLPPFAAARELGKFEAQIKASSTQKQVTEIKKPKAPPPISPVGSKVSMSKSLSDMDYDEYRRVRLEQMRKG